MPARCSARPATRSLDYLRERNLPWQEDHTNVDIAYTRNYIRHRLLPLLQRESPRSLIEDLSQLAVSAGGLYDRVQQEAERAWPLTVRAEADEIRIETSQLALLPEMVAIELIRRALANLGCGERDLTEHHYQGILQLARPCTEAKAVSLPDGFAARFDRGRIVLRRVCRAHHPGHLRCEVGVHSTPHTLTIPGRTRIRRIRNRRESLRTRRDRFNKGRGKQGPVLRVPGLGPHFTARHCAAAAARRPIPTARTGHQSRRWANS